MGIPWRRRGAPLFSAIACIAGAADIENILAPGFDAPVPGIVFAAGEATSGMPLGGLGTGFVDITSTGAFGDHVTENNWLRPRPVSGMSGIELTVGEKTVELFPNRAPVEGLRFWGHFPVADLFLDDVFPGARAHLRAFTPLVPHEYDLSNIPAALFTFRVTNTSDTDLPVEATLQWQAPSERDTVAEGNVEVAIGWHTSELEPGASWGATPRILVAHSSEALHERLAIAKVSDDYASKTDAPEGFSYSNGDLTEFLLDGFAGFNWEQHQRQSAVYAGLPTISQIMWELRYDGTRVGRGPNRGWGFMGGGLTAKTEDGKLNVSTHVLKYGDSGIAVVFVFENISGETIRDLQFGYSVNFDLGGRDHYEQNHARLDESLHGVVVTSDDGPAAALLGFPDTFYVGRWPATHEAMLAGELSRINQDNQPDTVKLVAHGLESRDDRTSYAVGGIGAGWDLHHEPPETNRVRTRAERTLAPGESSDVTFGLAWHCPTWQSSDGETLRHGYATRFEDAGDVLDSILPEADAIEDAIAGWQAKLYASSVPALLKDAVINGLYILPRNSWFLDDGRFFQSESFTGCPITETLVCRFNGSFPLALMWPECEKATMAELIAKQAESGQIPFSVGAPAGTQTPNFVHQAPIVSTEFVLLAWRNYQLWQDRAYLERSYPAIKKAMQFALTLDTDGDGLVNEAPGSAEGFPANQYYDVWPWWGTSAYTGSISLAALHAAERAAREVDDDAFAGEMAAARENSANAFDRLLWTGNYYRLYNDPESGRISDTSLTNALAGQWFAYAAGLGTVVPGAHIGSVIDTVLRLNDTATAFGAVNGVKPDGTIDRTFEAHSAALTIGEVWNFCAMAAFAGRTEDAVKLFEESYRNMAITQGSPWNIPWSLNPDTGAIQWGIHYYSNPCVWTLLQALDPKTYAALGQ